MNPDKIIRVSDNRPLLFLSDVHLGAFSTYRDQRIEEVVINLIDYAEVHEIQLYVLGDLFDYWMEYPNSRPQLGERMLHRFYQYNQKFGPTLYITGNHDNWTRSYFEEIGFDLEQEYRILKTDYKTTLLHHGDGFATDLFNLPRPLLHRFLRNPYFVKVYQTIFPESVGVKLMQKFSGLSRRISPTTIEKQHKLNEWAVELLKSSDFDTIVCGHDHIPRQIQADSSQFINLGAFYEQKTVGMYNNGIFDLVRWDDVNRQLTKHQSSVNQLHE